MNPLARFGILGLDKDIVQVFDEKPDSEIIGLMEDSLFWIKKYLII